MDLLSKKEEINALREKIYAITANEDILYKNKELINLSEELDILINEYIHMSRLKKDL
ncbi:Spo0E family sporulation regulatory protein-aspartic acid phosphatase [Tepidibacter mesophilus]|uniref:Spo0E family sporulation regulatory protein-aspartic acid phosphatase n=1 Tax=Tepidibacter mesophilus TaxID=655607 RepID=UPI000C070429|nr:Spo0E family sporulation regulatory protein-aspartic acid phosphatase [Tepidibacter mesophilus]